MEVVALIILVLLTIALMYSTLIIIRAEKMLKTLRMEKEKQDEVIRIKNIQLRQVMRHHD